MELIKRILAHFFTTRSERLAAQLLINTGRSDKSVLRIMLSKVMMAHYQKKISMRPKFFLQISDQQQSVAPAPSRDLPHTPSSADGR